MANEFVARKGLIVPTGSIWVMDGAVTASNFLGTASKAVSSSYALTASYADSGTGFPFTGNAVITGSLDVTQAVTASFFKGDGSQLTNISAAVGQSALRIDGYQFEADGINVVYLLSESIYTANDLIVTVGGVTYTPTVDYVFSSNSLIFTETPPSGSNITVRAFVAVTSGSINVLSGSFSGSFVGNISGVVSGTSSVAISSSYASNADLLDGKDSTLFATTGSNTFVGSQTIKGSLLLSSSFPLVYNNDNTNNMLFGFFDGSSIYGAYYQTFGNNYASLSQRGGAEFVYDVRNNSDANFHVASFNGSTWTEKFRVDDTGIIVTGSIKSTSGVTGSLFGTSSNAVSSSYAVTSSFASNVLKTKAGSVVNTSFGGTPLTASVTFNTAFGDTNYAIAITGEDSRAWTIQNKTTSGFEINTVSNTALTGTTYWTCTAYGEN